MQIGTPEMNTYYVLLLFIEDRQQEQQSNS